MKLFETNDTDDRGQVGIGTLIIFIAMVLVAAVAAGVLINTAGLLESRASDTGADAQAQVSNQIQVVTATGGVNNTAGTVDNITLVVKKSPGADSIDLEDATIHFVSNDNEVTLVHATSASGTEFAANSSTDVISGDADLVLDDSTERIQLTVDLDQIGNPLDEGEGATLRMVDQSGAQTVYGVNVPETLSDESYVEV